MVARSMSEILGELLSRVGKVERRLALRGGAAFALPDRIGVDGQKITDWNDAIEDGWYYSTNAIPNAPDSSILPTVMVMNNPSLPNPRRLQIAYFASTTNSATVKEWRRVQNVATGVWGAWLSMDNQPQYRQVYYTSAASIPTGSWTRANFNALGENVGTIGYGSGVFTVPFDGIYQIHGQVRFVTGTTGQRTSRLVFSNGDVIEGQGFPAASGLTIGGYIEFTARMLAGDQVEVQVYQSQGAAVNTVSGLTYSNASVALISRTY